MSDNPAARFIAAFSDPAHIPEVSKHLGFELIGLDPEAMTVEAWFTARPVFLNPNGSVQGGIVTGFLDEAMSAAAFMATDLKSAVPTLEMKTSFLRPMMTGRARAIGQVSRLGSSVAFLEGRLWNEDGVLCATATATAALRPL
ncbi:PaaI family thioesterase [Alkalicaulis satelles]|uniref:PaaI family thioesterase n=1 Tax=Alkalicaulis satelles TaxID=2609175 RepID=A0A5M6ZF39_9PROT|nr:PaaI family thioesterase [Alkalicaulis satelles]KAA5802377.1 PaaI family thioesterase [Alkalicaulis satelles]